MTDRKPDGSSAVWIDRRDIIALLGLGLLGYGSWLVFAPAGFIVPGAILSAVAVFGVRG